MSKKKNSKLLLLAMGIFIATSIGMIGGLGYIGVFSLGDFSFIIMMCAVTAMLVFMILAIDYTGKYGLF